MDAFIEHLSVLIQRGGYIMIPLLALSVVSLALVFERCWFWLGVTGQRRNTWLSQLAGALRRGDHPTASKLTAGDTSPYGRIIAALLEHGINDSVSLEAVEAQRPRIDRFMVTLSTIITAAPLLGILGTVIGIIQSFNLLGSQTTLTDPRVVSEGIAEALLTTALGLIVALFALFPYMAFRKQADRMMGRLESLIAAAQQGLTARTADNVGKVRVPPADRIQTAGKV